MSLYVDMSDLHLTMSPLIVSLLLVSSVTIVTGISMETCDVSGNSVVINPSAGAHIGMIYSLRKQGTNG